MNRYSNILRFFRYHKNGLLGIVIVHLLILNVLLLVKISSYDQKRRKEIVINWGETETKEEKPQKEKPDPAKEINPDKIPVNNINYSNHAKNLAQLKKAEENLYGNMTENKNFSSSKEYKEKVIKKALSKEAYDQYTAHKSEKNGDVSVPERNNIKPKEPSRDSLEGGQKKVFKGPTTITYYLEDRTDIYLPVPVYKCEGGGIVSLQIMVDQSGKVITAKINKEENFPYSECLQKAALKAAKNTVFNYSPEAPQKQKGKITYQFIPQ